MSYRSKIKICGIKSAAEARAVLACSSVFCANLERADEVKNLPQSGDESSMKTPNFCGENSGRNFNPDVENFTRNFNSDGQNFAQNFNQSGENSACRAQDHANFTCEQNSNCDKNFGSGLRSQGDDSGVRMEFLGVIFVSSSKRRVSVETAREIARIAHEKGAKCVGVFALSSEKHSAAASECKNLSDKTRGDKICKDKIYASKSGGVEFYEATEFCEKQRNDLSINLNANCATPASMEDLNSEILDAEALGEEQILKICEICELDCAQIYGRISADFKARLNAAGIEAWQVLSIGAEMPPLKGLSFDRILFDAKGVSLGGNGVSFDWDLLRRVELGYEGQYGAASDAKRSRNRALGGAQNSADGGEKCYAADALQGSYGARRDLELSAIYSGHNERNLKRDKKDGDSSCTKFGENEISKLARGGVVCCAFKSDEAGECARAVVLSDDTRREASADRRANGCEAGALDIAEGSKAGGSGFAKDDSADRRGDDPQNGAISFILAGGIGPQNVLEALALRPYAIDLNSRVEDVRGIKEPQKISEILQIIESADG